MFIERINTVTGEREWIVAEEDYDCAQEIARSRFGDMILDYDRNDKFLAGLQTVISELQEQNKFVHVLDIGTGTGLLSLMAAREGADKVTALEVFHPMAKCAKKITKKSQWARKIEVVSSRSTDLTKLDVEEKPNVIVAEVFDTELNGEGALRTFKEALENLCQPNTRVIPSLGRVWIMPVQSEFLKKFNRVPRLDGKVNSPSPLGQCSGTASVFDVQLSQVPPKYFKQLAEKQLAFSFDFEDASKIIYNESRVIDIPVSCSGQVDAILMWWDLDMDRTGKNWIDMAPKWNNPQAAWRDHWMQAVYYLPQLCTVTEGETLQLRCNHDEFSMWFEETGKGVTTEFADSRPYCSCSLHSLLSRYSIFRMNELIDNDVMDKHLKRVCTNVTVVCVSEGSLLGLQAAKYASNVVIVDSNERFRQILSKYKSHYQLSNVSIVSCLEDVQTQPDVLISEPFYLSAMNPWDNLRFLFDARSAIIKWPHVNVYPKRGRLVGTTERFVDLWKIANPVGTVNGFDLSEFDKLSQKARQATDAIVDEQSLWEYDGVLTGDIFEILSFDVSSEVQDQKSEVQISMRDGSNGIPLWMEWEWGDECWFSTGLLSTSEAGKIPEWNEGFKQGVFLPPPKMREVPEIFLSTSFSSTTGDISFQFSE